MKISKHISVTASLLAALCMGFVAQTASADDSPWGGAGSGTTTVISDGSVSPAEFTYDNPGEYSGIWSFDTVASTTRTVLLKYKYTGFHAYFQVKAALDLRNNGGITTLVSDGPVNCCNPPSSGFEYSGYTVLSVVAGDTYGFDMRGSHFDSNQKLTGTLTVEELNAADCKKEGWQTYRDECRFYKTC